MTDEQARIQTLESKYHDVDKRQESFETFVKTYIQKNDETIRELKESNRRMDERMDRFEVRMDKIQTDLSNQIQSLASQIHNMAVGFAVGVGAILVTVLISIFNNKG